ncbi:uncharacterized protein LOC110111742 isoform X2 [Dendrobium catenatum]|uniref:uncharacterized protein LOC110111742 isoform X2 n=1 Tax=Dendrobium catenatum TaxID=906689 RepID=UPI0009F2F5DF|nr:uncharacterized protein LOC110111742 isoform X2 [Dendrobium catenatum]
MSSLICDHCIYLGHMKSSCYHLHLHLWNQNLAKKKQMNYDIVNSNNYVPNAECPNSENTIPTISAKVNVSIVAHTSNGNSAGLDLIVAIPPISKSYSGYGIIEKENPNVALNEIPATSPSFPSSFPSTSLGAEEDQIASKANPSSMVSMNADPLSFEEECHSNGSHSNWEEGLSKYYPQELFVVVVVLITICLPAILKLILDFAPCQPSLGSFYFASFFKFSRDL